jgi:transposase InsO family protein
MEKFAIEPLSVDNYATWSIKMKMKLIQKGLWHAITDATAGTIPASTDSMKALSLIALNVQDHHLQAINACTTAQQAWLMLEATYKGKSLARALQLRRELVGLKKGVSEPLTVYVARAETLAAELATAGHTVSQTEVAYALLAGLPTEYDTAVTVMQMSGQELTLSSLLPRLLPIEQRMKSETTDNAAYTANLQQGGQSKQQGFKQAACFKCLQPGHMVAQCKNAPAPQAKKCKKCGRWGHTAERCARLSGKASTSQQVAFTVGDIGTKLDWILDSGCSNHITPDSSKFITYEKLNTPVAFTFANGQKANAVARGDIQLQVGNLQITLKSVLHVPASKVNLLSINKIQSTGAQIQFSEDVCKVYKNSQLLFQAECRNGLYTITDTSESSNQTALFSKPTETAQLWHQRFGHLSYKGLAQLVRNQMVSGIHVTADEFEQAGKKVCQFCVQAKQARLPFPTSQSTTKNPMELVHMDVCGPMPVQSPGGSRYFATFLDDHSKFSAVVPINNKSDVPDIVKRTIKQLETQTGQQLKSVRTDRGGEYLNHSLRNYFDSKGVLHQTTTPYNPEQNGAAERLNRTLMERVRAMQLSADLRPELWAEAVVTANYIRNRSPTSKSTKTPWEQFTGNTPDVSGMRVFGTRAFVMVPKELRHKLDPVSEPGIFVGYSASSKAYRVLLDGSNKVVESRDVVFDETARSSTRADMHSEDGSDSDKEEDTTPSQPMQWDIPVPEQQQQQQQRATPSIPVDLNRSNTEEGELRSLPRSRAREDQTVPDTRYPQRDRRSPGNWYEASHHAHLVKQSDEPTTVEQALSAPDAELWKHAMDEEMASLAENKTW